MSSIPALAKVIPVDFDPHGKSLLVKFGVDPTAPDLHLGHFVVFRTLRQLQALGHQVVLVVGDATARIGDPSGRNKTRPILTKQVIEENLKTYLEQVKPLLDWKKVRVVRNSEWFDKLGFADLIALAQHVTVSQILERDDFSERFKDHAEIGLQELYYPLMQAYDSYTIGADVEIGGTDQLFNMLLGRDLGRKLGGKEQVVIATELLVGTDGVKKMSKSYSNAIGVSEPAAGMLQKLMQIPDEAMYDYAKLLTDLDPVALQTQIERGANPRDIKMQIAQAVVEQFKPGAAAKAADEFERVVTRKELPERVPEHHLSGTHLAAELLRKLKLTASNAEARRVIAQGGLRVGQQRITDPDQQIKLSDGLLVYKGKKQVVRIRTTT